MVWHGGVLSKPRLSEKILQTARIQKRLPLPRCKSIVKISWDSSFFIRLTTQEKVLHVKARRSPKKLHLLLVGVRNPSIYANLVYTLQWPNISHLRKRYIIFNSALVRDIWLTVFIPDLRSSASSRGFVRYKPQEKWRTNVTSEKNIPIYCNMFKLQNLQDP